MPKSARATSVRPLPTRPAQPDDLAAAHREADVAELARARQPVDLEQHLAGRRLPVGVEADELAADHHCDCPVAREGGGRLDADQAAVAQYRDPVGDAEDLVHPVADEHHSHALLAQRGDDREELLHFALRQRGRRLVHDQDARLQRERTGDLDQLLLGGPEAAEFRADVDR